MKKILTILMCLLLVPIVMSLEADPSDIVFSTEISTIQYTALGETDCSEWNNKCSPTKNAYYRSCYRKSDGKCSCYLTYCKDGYNCIDGACKKECTTGYSWHCSGDYKVKIYIDANCNEKEVGKYYCGSGKTCEMDGTTATCIAKCNPGTIWECSTLSPTRINKMTVHADCTVSQSGSYYCNEGYICSDAKCIKEGKCVEGYKCPEGYTCKIGTKLGKPIYYFCSKLYPNKYQALYISLDCSEDWQQGTCASGYTCEAGDCVKLETGCSNPTAKVNEFYCKSGNIYKCSPNNQWVLTKTFVCPSGSCKTSTPSTDYKSLCSVQTCSKSQYPDKCGADGKLYYNIHLSSNKCVYSVKSCSSEEECIGGKCIELTTCTKNGRDFEVGNAACFGNDRYICTIDGTFYTEKNSIYCTSCSDECQDDNFRECYGDGFRVCGNYDEDDCLEWGETNPCDEGCEDGDCIIPSCQDIPESPCEEAYWIDYPECFWDISACEDILCGNEIIDPGESCENCPADVICNPNEFCFDHTCILRAEVCDNELDDDNDGLIDCNDEDCFDSEICEPCSTGNTLKKRCPDGSTIVTHECLNGEYKKTGNECGGQIPSWIIPTIIGVLFLGGLIVILLQGKKKKRRK